MQNLKYLEAAVGDAVVVELRHQRGPVWSSGLFDNVASLAAAAEALSDDGNLYTSLNRPRHRRATNVMNARALRDASIDRIVRIPFDFDPYRPSGQPSSASEQQEAEMRRDRLVTYLTSRGWPIPALGASGNGGHAIYRCDLPASPETALMLTAIYQGLADMFGAWPVSFDTSVRNPSRVFRLYGTVNRKGEPTAERPHRRASIDVPDPWLLVPTPKLRAMAENFAMPCRAMQELPAANERLLLGAGDYTTLDVVGWFGSHGKYRRRITA